MFYSADNMGGVVRTVNQPKRKPFLYVFLSLCLLITSCVVSPHLGEFAEKHASSPLSMSCYFQDYAPVSVAPRARDNPRRPNHAKDNVYSRTASTHGACSASQTYLQFLANLYRNMARLCGLAGISNVGLHRACELLDIPPPSNTLSF